MKPLILHRSTIRFLLIKYLIVFIALLSVLPQGLAAESTESGNNLSIGAALALTGSAAPFGVGELNGMTLATEEWNSRGGISNQRLILKVEDTKASNAGTVTAVTKLISVDRFKYLLGPTWLDSYGGALPIAEKAGVLLLTPSAAITVVKREPGQYPLVFSTWYNLELEISSLLDFVKKDGAKKIAVVFDNDPFFQAIDRSLMERIKSLGVEVPIHESYNLGDHDFRGLFSKIKSYSLDGVIFGFGDEGGLHSFLKQRQDLAPHLKFYGTDYLEVFAAVDTFKGLLEGLRYVSPAVHDPEFALKYQGRFKTAPTTSASTAYDAANLLFNALQSGHSDPASIAKFLSTGRHDSVTFGPITFDPMGGVSSSQYAIKEIKSGKIQIVAAD